MSVPTTMLLRQTRIAGTAITGRGSSSHAAHHDAGVETAPFEPEHSDRPVPCDCVGSCHSGTTTALLAIPALRLAAAAAPNATVRDPRRPLPRHLPFVLPYANGPPRTLSFPHI